MSKTDLEKQRQYKRDYYYRNREVLLEKQKIKRAAAKKAAASKSASQKRHRAKAATTPSVFLNYMYSTAKARAKERGLKFNLTKEDLAYRILTSNGRCEATGMFMSTENNSPDKMSIDRIDSSKGYVKDNVRIVTAKFNFMKNHFSDSEFAEVATGFLMKHKKR